MGSVTFLLIASVLFFLRTAVDITAFFLLMRAVSRKSWAPKWVAPFDSAGASLVEGVLKIFDRIAARFSDLRWREEAKLCLMMILLFAVRLALG